MGAAEESLPFDPARVPEHIAIIMDGNGRWAQARDLPRRKGHEAGVETIRDILKACNRWGVKVLTLYAFSSENWSRPRLEVEALMLLLRSYLQKEREELNRENVRLSAIGDLERLPKGARRELDKSIDTLSGNTGVHMVLALSYGSRDEILRATRVLARRCCAGDLSPEDIDETTFSGALDTAGLPDPDLLIRTAGEMRISNFLLWQISYAEYYSTPVFWPDFRSPELAAAILAYQERDRKYGGLKDASSTEEE
ncbi:MAG: isoprenyl transferase [Planctomycetota bacterium]|jgi:undecaprenyl diphosphate synthase